MNKLRTLALLTTASLLITACTGGQTPGDTSGVATVEVTVPASTNLRLNSTATFSAVTKAADGTVVTGKTLTWKSSNPDVASVDANGVVTARRFGSATISASVGSVTGNKTATLRTYGVEAFLGIRDGGEDTAVLLRYRTATGAKPTADKLTFTVTGPPGWNGGQPVPLEVSKSTYFSRNDGADAHWFQFGWTKAGNIAAVVGDYKVEYQVDGETWSSTAKISSLTNSSKTPTGIAVTGYGASTVTATWDDVLPGGSYQAEVLGFYPVVYTSESKGTLNAVGLSAGQAFNVGIHALSLDVDPSALETKPLSGQFDVRFNTAAFTKPGTSANAARVMPLGDSITDGFNIPGGYRIPLYSKLSTRVPRPDLVGSQQNGPTTLGDRDHEGYSGKRIDEIAAGVNGWLDAQQPDTVMLMIGTNDMIQGYDVANAPARLGALLDQMSARRPNTRILVASLPPLADATHNARVQAYNAALPAVVQARANAGKKVTLVNAASALTTADLADGVHPNEGGYGKLANVWYDALVGTPDALTPQGAASRPLPATNQPLHIPTVR
ncbi:GDSL-type esterase/lipase family protein [Deinococcus sp. YIM 134068]|uniref:GDSL-type esterase/lipase family protein n=1 Tax=Deinococcus lichenicola TaxID=3118910 RepID=UPI002F91CB92